MRLGRLAGPGRAPSRRGQRLRLAALGRARTRARCSQVGGLEGCMRTALSSARARRLRCRPAPCSIAASSNSGSTDSGLIVARVGDLRARARSMRPASAGASASCPRAPQRCGCQAVQARHAAPSRDGGAGERRRATARRTASRARQARPLGSSTGPAARDPARAQQREHGVAGDEPGPVDERVHAEDDARSRAASPCRRARASTAPGAAAPQSPACARRRRSQAAEQRQRRPRARRCPRSASVCTT